MQNERLGSSPAEEEVGITAWGRHALVLQNIKPFIPTGPNAGVTPVRTPLCPEQEGVRGRGAPEEVRACLLGTCGCKSGLSCSDKE